MYANSASGFRHLLTILLPIIVFIFGLVCLGITVAHTDTKVIALHFPLSEQESSFVSLTPQTSTKESNSQPATGLVMLFSALAALAALAELAIIAVYTMHAQKISAPPNSN